MRLFLSFAMSLLFLAATTPVDAQLDIFFARADDGSVDVTFDGSGMIGDGIANFLTIGTNEPVRDQLTGLGSFFPNRPR